MKRFASLPALAPIATAAAALIAALLSGCATPANEGGASPPPPSSTATSAASAPDEVPPATRLPTSVAGEARSFSTGTATYTSVGFDAVPGWYRDDLSQTWPAFLGSCGVLNQRTAWRRVCERARGVDGRNNTAIRNFFEQEFTVYQIRDDDRRTDGVVTGYFEPELTGSRNYAPPNVYPVYGAPADMLYLDTRRLPASGVVAARVEGRNVAVQPSLNTRDLGGNLYALDLSQVKRDTLDRRMRLRIEGRRLLPYYTREEIETRGVPNARVLAFVNNPAALYEMQIQGSGRIRLTDGSVIRVGYADQNGQPVRPMLTRSSSTQVRTRGGQIELDPGDDDDSVIGDQRVETVRVRGFRLSLPDKSGPVAVPGRSVASASGGGLGTGNSDPSYVFFKEIANNTAGPPGALGVPLSPERSIAVDPRSTPLGYPVFVSTRQPDTKTPMQRLTIAQDTGGMIRGAVRADYFFGNGQRAAAQARRMKERGELWLLLPRGQVVTAAANAGSSGPGGTRVRGVRGAGDDDASAVQCLVPEDGVCVND